MESSGDWDGGREERFAIFTMLILPTQEHGRSYHFLLSSSISFLKDLKFLSYKSSTCLVRVTPRYFMLFVAIVKGVDSLISSPALLSFVYSRATVFLFCFVLVNLVSCYIAESVYEL